MRVGAGGREAETAGAPGGRSGPEPEVRAPRRQPSAVLPPPPPPAAADWRGPQHQLHLPERGGRRDRVAATASGNLSSLPARPRTFPARHRLDPLLLPASPHPPRKVETPGSQESHVWSGPAPGGRGQFPGAPRHHRGPRSAAVSAPQPPRRLVSCTAGRAGLRPRWAGRAWGAPAPRGAPCSARRAGAASPPPSRRWPATFPA